jgi:periplasmic protein CpxP/Spy
MKSKASFTKRAVLVGLLAGSGILAASAYATADRESAGTQRCDRHAMKANQWEAHHAERMAGLKDKLKLAPEQEAAWNTFAEASQPGPRHMDADREAMRSEFEKLNTPQRLDRMLAVSEVRRARMAERVAATKAFYAQLSAEQQRVFDAEAMLGLQRGHRHHHPRQS